MDKEEKKSRAYQAPLSVLQQMITERGTGVDRRIRLTTDFSTLKKDMETPKGVSKSRPHEAYTIKELVQRGWTDLRLDRQALFTGDESEVDHNDPDYGSINRMELEEQDELRDQNTSRLLDLEAAAGAADGEADQPERSEGRREPERVNPRGKTEDEEERSDDEDEVKPKGNTRKRRMPD